jgi:hypothetical protein
LNNLIAALHGALSATIRVAWSAISWMPVVWQLVVVSILLGTVLIIAFGRLSRQGAIRRVKGEISAALMEVVLFRRDPRLALAAQARLLHAGGRYFCLALMPMLILALPCTVVLAHLHPRFGVQPIGVHDQVVLSAQLDRGSDLRSVALTTQGDLAVVGPVRIPRSDTVVWRLSPQRPGIHQVTLQVGDSALTQQVLAGAPTGQPLGVYLSKQEPLQALLFPNAGGGFTLPAGQLRKVELKYPEKLYSIAGVQLSWISVFLIVSLIFGLVAGRILGISV